MKKRIFCLVLAFGMLFSLAAAAYAADDEENHPSVTYRLLSGASAEIIDGETGEPIDGGIIKIILNYGDQELIIDTDGTELEHNRSATVASFSTMSDTEIPDDLTDEEIAAIYGDSHSIEEEEIPVIAVTGFDTMIFANNLVDHVSPELTVSEKSGIQTITGMDYETGILTELAYQLSQNNPTARELLEAFDGDKVLLEDVKDTIAANTEKLQATLNERIEMLTSEMSGLDAASAEYASLAAKLQVARETLAETEKDGYEDLSNYTPMTILDISMNSKARAMLGETGCIRIYLSIDGLDYDDEIILVNTHASDISRAVEEVEKAEETGKAVAEDTIEEIFDQCSVSDCYVTPGAISPDGTVREIPINEMDTAVLADDEVLEPRVNLEITKTSPFIVLMRNPETELCRICNNRSPLFLGFCRVTWTAAAAVAALVLAGFGTSAAVKKSKKNAPARAAAASAKADVAARAASVAADKPSPAPADKPDSAPADKPAD